MVLTRKSKIIVLCFGFGLFFLTGCNSKKYDEAINLMSNSDYASAKEILIDISDYKDSSALAKECDYQIALQMVLNRDFENGKALFNSLKGYKDVDARLESMTSSVPGVSDYTYFYGSLLWQQLRDRDFRNNLKEEIQESVLKEYGDWETYGSTPGKESGVFFKNLDCTKTFMSDAEACISNGAKDALFVNGLKAYYCLDFEVALDRAETGESNGTVLWEIYEQLGIVPDINTAINNADDLYEELILQNGNIDEIAKIEHYAAGTMLGTSMEFEFDEKT